MKAKYLLLLASTVFAAGTLAQSQKPEMTARDYFNEIYAAGGLDGFADGHVCFVRSRELF